MAPLDPPVIWDGTGCEFDSWQCRILSNTTYPMFIEHNYTITQVPSGFSRYIWLDTKNCVEKLKKYLDEDEYRRDEQEWNVVRPSHRRGIQFVGLQPDNLFEEWLCLVGLNRFSEIVSGICRLFLIIVWRLFAKHMKSETD